jgi:hypothetical protein
VLKFPENSSSGSIKDLSGLGFLSDATELSSFLDFYQFHSMYCMSLVSVSDCSLILLSVSVFTDIFTITTVH